ncbi:hypothetical protein H5410_022332 [Solanum commersonii]|uniref:Replication factor A C-terminal domain-containing protein n=1 Tax=Solanum commersonii TaxID=4109 RepID=A0A9J5ZDN4_SOLCO|nr:hypothetical protein H5410_022332 [Solanum commersonii]
MQWILKVRVIRKLIVPDKHKPKLPFSLELILQDEKVVSYKPFKDNKEGDNDEWLFKVVLEDDKLLVASCGPKFVRIFQTNSQQYTIQDELSKGIVPFKFLSDLIQCTEESAYWIAAKVVCLKLDHGWSYLAFNKCFTMMDQEENKYYCSNCNEEVISIIHRYNLQMYVTDGTAFISLLLGNREALQLIGKPAKELNEGLLKMLNVLIQVSLMI